MVVCKRVLFWGRVQGVGFRYTTRDVAGNYAVAGYVRNLPSGEVEVLAEGEDDQVKAFLAAVESQLRGYIAGRMDMDEPAAGNQGFVIRF